MSGIRRREFITMLGGAPVVWPLAAGAQQNERMRRIGVLMNLAADDPEGRARVAALLEGLRELGWTDGKNVRIDTRWAAAKADRYRTYAEELVALAPDAIVTATTPGAAAMQQATRTVPIIFVIVLDPVAAGFVSNLARPGGNITGFALYDYGISAKWLELLKQIAPNVSRVAVIRDPSLVSGVGQLAAIQAVAASFGVELSPVEARDPKEMELTVAAFARSPNGGLIVPGSAAAAAHRNLLISLAAKYRLPAIYFARYFVADGGLVSYGTDLVDQFRRAASYVDRILKGERPADLPVQAPTKYELVINLKTANALGLTVPPALLARADEVIE
jgi:putative tryptophan/tyrosine transport system substrate-binding protein